MGTIVIVKDMIEATIRTIITVMEVRETDIRTLIPQEGIGMTPIYAMRAVELTCHKEVKTKATMNTGHPTKEGTITRQSSF